MLYIGPCPWCVAPQTKQSTLVFLPVVAGCSVARRQRLWPGVSDRVVTRPTLETMQRSTSRRDLHVGAIILILGSLR